MKNFGPGKGKLSRRKFIDVSVAGTAGLGLSALPVSSVMQTGCQPGSAKTVYGACYHDCPDTCGWTVKVEDGKVMDFTANKNHGFTNGKLCNKMQTFPQDITFHPDRFLYPMKRIGPKGEGKFERVTWDQAISEVTARLKKILGEYGGESVLPYSFAGTQGIIQFNTMSSRFFAHIGASKLLRTICGSPSGKGTSLTMGNTMGMIPEDISKSKYIVIWGTNPVTSNQHLWPYILSARENGAKIVVIDPFLSHTAQLADWHIRPRPGTDTALALSLIHVLISEELIDSEYVAQYTAGFDELQSHVENYNPGQISQITGLNEDDIRRLAREYASAAPSAIRVLVGMEHQANGGSAFRAIACLPALTGAWQHEGGGLLHYTYDLFGQALNWEPIELADSIGPVERRSINMIRLGKALTSPELDPPVKALFVYNSNPVVITPNQNLVKKGLLREDLMTVVLEHFMTDTALYADYIFPATTQLEHWDLMDSWGQTWLSLNEPAIDPLGESKSNSDFFRSLASAMDFENAYLFHSDVDIIKKMLDSDHPYVKGISFKSLKEKGSIRLHLPDPWLPYAKGNFATESGKCEFYSPGLENQGISALPEYKTVKRDEQSQKLYPLQLLTLKSTKNFLNSSHANVGHLRSKEGKPFLDVHAIDAEKRQIQDGDEIVVFNQRGEMLITARISEKTMPGVICAPQGYWVSLIKGNASANALTTDMLTDLGEGGAFQETWAELRKA